MLEQKKIPFFKVGSHRRVRVTDVLAYKNKLDEDRLKILEEISAIAQQAEEVGEE